MELSHIASTLQATPKTLRALLYEMDTNVLVWRPAPGEWCINEVVGHLVESDRQAFMVRINGILKSEHYEIKPFNADVVAAQRHDDEWNVFDLIDELEVQRETCSSLILSLKPSDLQRSGVYPPHGEIRIADFVYEWAYHDCDHLQQILSNLKSRIRPHFSMIMKRVLSGKI